MDTANAVRLIDVFDLPEVIYQQCRVRHARTVGDLLAKTGTESSMTVRLLSLFCSWTMFDHFEECKKAVRAISEVLARGEALPAKSARKGKKKKPVTS